MKNKIELLAPAGDIECLVTAINAGADAVYFGLKEFNMRARSPNFSISDLAKIKRLADNKKVKLYLTLNTIVYDSELKKAEKIIKKVKNYVDAIICSDIAIMLLCRKYNVEVRIIDRFYPSSKLCSCCEKIKSDLKLSDRVYSCDCGNIIDRDYQASLNIKECKIYKIV